jgi:hypothetical protein
VRTRDNASFFFKNSSSARPTGEVYVLNDGGEVDLDLGNYERYLNVTLSRDNNITTGKIYREVIEKEVRRPIALVLCKLNIDCTMLGLSEARRLSGKDCPGL